MEQIDKIGERLVNQLAEIEIVYGHILPTDFQDAMLANIQALDERANTAEKALELVRDRGHNNDCLFCGFKDRVVAEYLKEAKTNGTDGD